MQSHSAIENKRETHFLLLFVFHYLKKKHVSLGLPLYVNVYTDT